MSRLRIVLPAAIAVAVALGGCGASFPIPARPAAVPLAAGRSGPSIAPTQMMTYDEMVAEYRATVPTLSWPAGVAPDPHPVTTDRSSSYEVGFGEMEAVDRWQCAWGGEYLANLATDHAAAAAALDQWASVTSLPAWDRAFSDPNTRRLLLDAIAKARRGDPSVIRSLQVANC
jgi:hypothetical protein